VLVGVRGTVRRVRRQRRGMLAGVRGTVRPSQIGRRKDAKDAKHRIFGFAEVHSPTTTHTSQPN
jgi:hypothetical protein